MKNTVYNILSIVIILFMGCNTDQNICNNTQAENSDIPTYENSGNLSTNISHRVAIRDRSDSRQEFYDTNTDDKFIPMGYNFTDYRLYTWHGVETGGHATFNDGVYNKVEISGMMADLKIYGYNTVRVFLDPFQIAADNGKLKLDYMSNVSDFLTTADENNICVIFTMDLIPVTKHSGELNSIEDFTWANDQYIYQDEIDLEKDFWSDFISYLIEDESPLEAILAYELRNEFAFNAESSPINILSGSVTNAMGNSYNLSDLDEVESLLVDSFKYWSKSVRDKIKSLDTNALVTIGFYANFHYLNDVLRQPVITAIKNSELDFVDLHMYPGEGKTVLEFMEHFELTGEVNKPIILGEFGIVKENMETKPLESELITMANLLISWKEDIINNYGLDGWLIWTWHTENGLTFSIKDDKLFLEELSPLD